MATVREALQSWIDALAARLCTSGLEDDRAFSVASLTVAAMEGSLILCRAEQGVAPLEAVASELSRLVE
jgi:hypothetical protein